MNPYIPLVVWTIGIVVCIWILRLRHVRATPLLRFVIAFFGPLAIPLVFFVKTGTHGGA